MSQKPWEHNKGAAPGSAAPASADPTAGLAARFVSSLDYDWRLYSHDIAGSIAHARMLQHVGLISPDDLAAIEAGLNEIKAEIDALGPNGRQWPGFKVELEDVHMCVEAALIEKVGEPGRKLHTGRSRNDQVAFDLQLWINDAEHDVYVKLREVDRALLTLAEQAGDAPMPAYTHLQRAQPISIGGELLAWAHALSIAQQRFGTMDGESWYSHLGAGAVAGSALPLDRQVTIDKIGDMEERYRLYGPTPSSIYSTAARDKAVDFVYACAMVSQWLSRWAEQWILYASTEFGFITLEDTFTTGSSMMPQKQNPDMLELIRGKSGSVYGCLVALLTMLKGLPVGYNRDLQEDKRHVFQAYDDVCDCLDMAAHIVAGTTFNRDKIEASLEHGFLDATSLAEYLVTRGVAFRTSHQVVGALVHQCRSTGKHQLSQLTVDDMNAAAKECIANTGGDGPDPAVGDDVYDWLGAANVVQRYQTSGNAGLTGFREQLAAWKERLNDSDQ
ncbi:MAG: argininosuccinate lyase [Planctomycetota bacterium]